jgi:hypothetical protein
MSRHGRYCKLQWWHADKCVVSELLLNARKHVYNASVTRESCYSNSIVKVIKWSLKHKFYGYLGESDIYFAPFPPPFFQAEALLLLLVRGLPFFLPPPLPPSFKSFGLPDFAVARYPSKTMLSGVLAMPSSLLFGCASLSPVAPPVLNRAAPALPSSLPALPCNDCCCPDIFGLYMRSRLGLPEAPRSGRLDGRAR